MKASRYLWTSLALVAWLSFACDAPPEEARTRAALAAHAHDHAHEEEEEEGTEHAHDHAHEEEEEEGTEHAHDHAHEKEGTEHAHASAGGLSEQELKGLPGVSLGPVSASLGAPSLKIPGLVRVDPDRRYSLSAPVSARIQVLDAPPLVTVSAGQRLAWLQIIDADVRHQQIRAVEVRAELLAAESERDRLRRYVQALQTKGLAVAAELARVEVDLQVAEAQLRSRASALKAVLSSLGLAGLSAAQIASLERDGQVVTHVALRAPRLAGGVDLEVAARPVHAGQTVTPGTPLYELVALDRLQVVGEAFEADLDVVRRAVREELPVSLLFPATGERVDDLRVFSVEAGTDAADEGLIRFYLWLPNRQLAEKEREGHRYLVWQYRAGARVQLLVSREAPSRRLVLPAAAVVREQGRHFVFRRDEQGRFRPLAVPVLQLDERQAVLAPDAELQPGEWIVLSGALQVQLAIKQASGPRAPSAHHGHAH